MFGFMRTRAVRRMLGLLGALLALAGGLLAIVAALPSGSRGFSLASPFEFLLGLGALFGAWWIHNGGKALLFPRARLSTAGMITVGIGVILLILGAGTAGGLVVLAGVVALVATVI